MGLTDTFLLAGLNRILANGVPSIIKIISFTNIDNDYDDSKIQTQTGSILTSGLLFPATSSSASDYPLLVQQGKILEKDKILYIGSVNISGNLLFNINNDIYAIIPDGIKSYSTNGTTIYNKIFLRYQQGGSLF